MEWQIFWKYEPPLADRLELALAILSSLTANMHRDSKKRPQPFTPRDFMVSWYQTEQEADEESDWGATAFIAFERMVKQQEVDEKMRGRIVARQE